MSPWAARKAFLAELGIAVVSHVVRIGRAAVPARAPRPLPEDLEAVDARRSAASIPTPPTRMVAEIDRSGRPATPSAACSRSGLRLPPGLGSYVHYDRKLDARLALALMSIQSVKGVEFGDGFATAARPGSKAHDEIVAARRPASARRTREPAASRAA